MFGAALPLGSAMAGMAAVFDPLPAAFSVFPCGCCVFAGGLLLTWEVTGLAGRLLLKGTVSRDFRPFFYLKFRPSHLGPIWIVKNGFANFFVFAKIFDCKVIRSQSLKIAFIWGPGKVSWLKTSKNIGTLSLKRHLWFRAWTSCRLRGGSGHWPAAATTAALPRHPG